MDLPDTYAPPHPGPRINRSQITFGLIIMGLGVMLLAERLHWWGVHRNVPFWPLVLILLGIARIGDRRVDRRGRPRMNRSGIWFVFMGAWGLLNEYRLFGLNYDETWPLLVIGVGAFILLQSIDPRSAAPSIPRDLQ
jgi:thiol:disulfide interchange protein